MTTKTHALALCLAAALAAGCTLTLDREQYAPKSAADCPGQKACGYKCVPLDDPATGCALTSCQPCPGAANAIATCGDTGACAYQCNLGWGDCDAATGCETKLDGTNPGNPSCGACARICSATSSCLPPGYCSPDSIDVSGAQPLVGIAVDTTVGSPSRVVYFATQSVIRKVDFNNLSVGPMPPSWATSVPSPINCFAGDGARLVYCSEMLVPAAATLNSIEAYTSTGVFQELATDPTSAPGQHLVALGPAQAWWVAAGSKALTRVDLAYSPPSVDALPVQPPATRWTALAVDALATSGGGAFAADDAEGGRLLRFDPVAPLAGSPVGSGAGTVGAVAVWNGEVYWGDLSTGDVIRQVGPNRTTIFKGKGPTARMRMAADAQGVYWADASAGTVMGYSPTSRSLVLYFAGGAPADLAVSGSGLLVWTGPGPGQIQAVQR